MERRRRAGLPSGSLELVAFLLAGRARQMRLAVGMY